MMNPEIRDQWADALESGEYKQTRQALTRLAEDDSKSHCCLGVLCELAVKAGVIGRTEADDNGLIGYGVSGERATLPYRVMQWAGLTEDNPNVTYDGDDATLAEVNDYRGAEFPEIAKLIKTQL